MSENDREALLVLQCICGESTVITMAEDRARWSLSVGCLCRVELTEEAENDLARGRLERQRKLIEFAKALLDDHQIVVWGMYLEEVGDY